MIPTPEQRAIGRRNFLKAVAGTPALATLGAASAMQGPVRGGPVRLGFIGLGGQGRALLGRVHPAFGEVKAMADINPASLAKADEVLAKRNQAPATHYVEWREMLEKENIEAVVVAVPLWAHADVAVPCLEAGKHVLNESEALLFDEGAGGRQTAVEVSSTPGGAGVEASETKPANNGPATTAAVTSAGPDEATRASATELEISAFCSAIRVGTPLLCGPQRAFDSARACIAACKTAKGAQTKVPITTT